MTNAETPSRDNDMAPVADRLRPSVLAVFCLSAGLAGCTGSDPGIAFGPSGPIPSVDIASVSMIGAPIASGAAMQQASGDLRADEPTPQYAAAAPLETVQRVPSSGLPPVRGGSRRMDDGGMGDGGMNADGPGDDGGRRRPGRAEPQRLAALPAAEPAETGSQAPASGGRIDREQPAGASVAEVQFLPLIGVPQGKAELLARALSQSAHSQGVTIRPAAEAKTDIRLKGYFSAFNDGAQTTLVYVWDVLDSGDNRAHRIQGQETIPGKAADPWSVVDARVLDAVADRTLREAAKYG